MMKSHSSVTVVEGGLVVSIDDKVYHIDLTLEDRISLASQLLSNGVVEMRNKAATDALMMGAGAGDVYVEEKEEG